MTLQGKSAIVTGGNSGIGKAIVLALAEAGANVVIDYVRNPDATDALEQQVAALGDKAIGVQADVSKVEDLQRLVDEAVKAFGRLDIMVNNAGVETRTSILDTTEQQYELSSTINLKSAFFGTQIAAQADDRPGRRRSHHQRDAPCTRTGRCRATPRTASPRAACGCSRAPPASSSPRTASRSSGVGPGAVDTPINKQTDADPEKLQKLNAAIPLGRMAEPERDRQRGRHSSLATARAT